VIKRTFDIISSLIGLLMCGPVLILVALLIKLDSAGPVIFRQVRLGRGFRPFVIYKFRTMVDEECFEGRLITVGEDCRITRLGRVLRKAKFDELPQLVNILKGDMSVVGPRPEVPMYVEMFREDYRTILSVRPGLTDLASLEYMDEAQRLKQAQDPEEEYKNTVLPEKISLAKLYVERACLVFDLAIIAQTLLRLAGTAVLNCSFQRLQAAAINVRRTCEVQLKALIMKWRRPCIIILDISLILLANYLAFWLRFDGAIPTDQNNLWLAMLPWLVSIRGVAFFCFGLNKGLWRYTSIWDLERIVSGVFTSTVLFYCWVHWGLGAIDYPRSVFIIDSILLVGFLTGVRLPSRLFRKKMRLGQKKRVMVIGAGDSGERIVREMKNQSSSEYHPIGLIDDQDSLVGQRIHGVKVLGTRKDLQRVVGQEKPEEVVLALPNASAVAVREIIESLESFKVSIKTVPNFRQLLADKSTVSQIRSLALEDLLPRSPIDFRAETVRDLISGKKVFITGAGGSIGSELCRQIALLVPEGLVLYERHENSLYVIAKELTDRGYSSRVHPVIGDIADTGRLYSVLEKYRPNIIFHAAAHKHVPLMELNAAEAFKNNCIGSRIVAEAADRFEVDRFVLISTDKAVNPTSVMGVTKRVAELAIQDISTRSKTRFLTVRFGNVLGSNGSVVLRFQEQIQAGGPVTVTHPGVRRYFMLIPEAVHLVLQAASLGEQGATYVLDMGEQIKVLDLARNLIRLSGFVPGTEIPITFVGLRPGEKLYEELVGDGEVAEPSAIDKILRIRTIAPGSASLLDERLLAFENQGILNCSDSVIDRLRDLVPNFRVTAKLRVPA
jgi:FlaA1/EpsC-like NDP-sugar epimerase/lipopolysaccharide/colanic/teichoic acid biosynthesis glycosyltransferase